MCVCVCGYVVLREKKKKKTEALLTIPFSLPGLVNAESARTKDGTAATHAAAGK